MTASTTASHPWRKTWLVLMASLVLAGCGKVTLHSDLDERQSNQVLSALLESGVSADKVIVGERYQVRVSQSDFSLAHQLLSAQGLPHQQYVSTCEVFQRQGFVSSATEERARLQCSWQQELEQTFTRWPGVANARVHLALPERDPIGGAAGQASASVVIYEQAGANVKREEHHFKVLVKDAVPGLTDPNQVSIKFTTLQAPRAQVVSQRSPAPAMSAMSPVTLGVVAGVIALIALVMAFGNRLRQRKQAQAKPDERVWKG